jgi:hypothetical protein
VTKRRWSGHTACTGTKQNAYKILVRKPNRTRMLGRPWCREEDNIGMDLKETGCEDVDWIHLAQVRTSGGLK